MRQTMLRRTVITAGALALTLTSASPALAKTQHKPVKHETIEHALIHWVNVQRVHAGLRPLVRASELTAVAHKHTAHMAKVDEVFHDATLSTDIHHWRSLGENVGSASSLRDLEKAFLSEPSDRVNILGAGFRQIGVGVNIRDGLLYVTILVSRPSSS